MPKLLTVCLTPEQQEQLEHIRDNDKRPYVCERAAAILKIAEGASGRQVALDGLLKQRKPDTIYDWVERIKNRKSCRDDRKTCKYAIGFLKKLRIEVMRR